MDAEEKKRLLKIAEQIDKQPKTDERKVFTRFNELHYKK